MHIRIGISGNDREAALIDLYRWLLRDADVSRHATVDLSSDAPGAGTMGAIDVINLVVGQGLTVLNLALSYAAWRNARPSAPAVTITVDGGSVTVHDASEETVRRIVAELAFLNEPQHRGDADDERSDGSPGTG
ncbi:hypothetical protein PV733_38470 [Streptomyces europaeiscabiei]|uniref:effector-associated constant component EACC1 n=1 Tax=Streptomyces europaeiscabiei TaxID=146819 RepID=UPI0029B54106|nr:hypothetical protein [Streptomyces europaeiscabiei]MDX3714715.1 hypothetical protein [Streptomyces europaeiscabiei]